MGSVGCWGAGGSQFSLSVVKSPIDVSMSCSAESHASPGFGFASLPSHALFTRSYIALDVRPLRQK